MKKVIFIFLNSLLFISCMNNTFYDVIFRTPQDPFYDTPSADSMKLEHTVFLEWNNDPAADTFRLMKSFDQNELSFECIYEGTENSYIDTELLDSCKYVYRLDKVRGSKIFKGNTYAYGWSSDCRKDNYESNDLEQNASFLEYDLICNLPCAGFITDSKEILDEDWFYVTIPPMRQADIIVGQHNLSDSRTGAETNLRIQLAGLESQNISHQIAYAIKNTSYETKNFYFRIFPEKTYLASGNSFYTVIEYTISLNQIIKY